MDLESSLKYRDNLCLCYNPYWRPKRKLDKPGKAQVKLLQPRPERIHPSHLGDYLQPVRKGDAIDRHHRPLFVVLRNML
jgi:hypothetical protein